jgi:hypothetical protein
MLGLSFPDFSVEEVCQLPFNRFTDLRALPVFLGAREEVKSFGKKSFTKTSPGKKGAPLLYFS